MTITRVMRSNSNSRY